MYIRKYNIFKHFIIINIIFFYQMLEHISITLVYNIVCLRDFYTHVIRIKKKENYKYVHRYKYH